MEQTLAQTLDQAVDAYRAAVANPANGRAAEAAQAAIDRYAGAAGLRYVPAMRVVRDLLWQEIDAQASAEDAGEAEILAQGGWR